MQLSENERRDIEEQTLLLWIEDNPGVGLADFDYGSIGRGVPDFDCIATLRRLLDKGLIEYTIVSRGWFHRRKYRTAKLTPAQKITTFLEGKPAQQFYQVWAGVSLERNTTRRTLTELIKKGWIAEEWIGDVYTPKLHYRLIELPF